jgi:hypothetical protein
MLADVDTIGFLKRFSKSAQNPSFTIRIAKVLSAAMRFSVILSGLS